MEDLPCVGFIDPQKLYFDPTVDQSSPLVTDFVRTVHHDEKKGEYVTYDSFDSAAYQKELGPVDNWSLDALLKAGIDPRFGVHTTSPSRIEGFAAFKEFADAADKIYNESNNE